MILSIFECNLSLRLCCFKFGVVKKNTLLSSYICFKQSKIIQIWVGLKIEGKKVVPKARLLEGGVG